MKPVLVLFLLIFVSGCLQEKIIIEKTPASNLEKGTMSYFIGQKISIDGISYSIDKVENYEEIGESSVSKKAEGTFYLVYLSIENKNVEEGYIFSPRIALVDDNEIRYSPDLKARFYISNTIDWEKTLYPGVAHRGVIVFDVPNEAKGFKLEIRNDWEKLNKVYIEIPMGAITRTEIMQEVVDSRNNTLLQAGINYA